MHYTHFGTSHSIAMRILFQASNIGIQPPFGQLLMTIECEVPSLRIFQGNCPPTTKMVSWYSILVLLPESIPLVMSSSADRTNTSSADLDAPCRTDAEAADMMGDDKPEKPTQAQRKGSDA